MTAVGALTVLRARRLLDLADLAAALSCAALGANPRVFRPALHRLKPVAGQRATAARLARFLRGGEFARGRVQDAYSLRCVPQVHGAVREGVGFAQGLLETEANAVTDNPVLLGGAAVPGGNFHGAAIALGLDTLAVALTQLAAMSERRVFRLLDPQLSGLPPFLSPDAGVNSGLMLAQMLAATLVTDCKLLAAPASIHSLPTSAGQEDFVSMGMNSAVKARNLCDKVETIVAVELLCAAQGLELSGLRKPPALVPALRRIRSRVPPPGPDRELHTDIAAVKALLPELVA
jgi:histidine ammonia-lyase